MARAIALAVPIGMWLVGAACRPMTPLRPGDYPIAGTRTDARPDPVVRHAPLAHGESRERSIEDAVKRGIAEEISRPLALATSVGFSEGHVTLAGTYPSAHHRRRAEIVARAVAGVRDVRNEIRVEPVAIADSVVAENVRATLEDLPSSYVRAAMVRVDKGRVQLSGLVPHETARVLVEERAAEVEGVVDVVNRLSVVRPAVQPKDEEIRAELIGRFARLGKQALGSLEAKVVAGVVTLSGKVPTFAIRRRLVNRAWVPGVRGVNAENVRVVWRRPMKSAPVPGAQPREADVRVEVQEALAADPLLVDTDVRVSVAEGTLVLSGDVPTLAAVRAASEAAELHRGGFQVDNRIVVAPAATPDQELARRVLRALERDAYIDHRTIAVRVKGGVVSLTGTVDAPFEQDRAALVAARVAGVRDVVTSLALEREGVSSPIRQGDAAGPQKRRPM